MVLPTAYIGAAHALFAVIVILMKRPLRITDKILAVWLIAIVYLFVTQIVLQSIPEIDEGAWVFTLGVLITFPPFLYLYSRYVTGEYERFKKSDLWHGVPVVIFSALIYLFRNPHNDDFVTEVNYYNKILWLKSAMGIVFVLSLWAYGALALMNVKRYKKQLNNIYSFESDKISLSWLRFVVISFVVTFNLLVLFGILRSAGVIDYSTQIIRDIGLLLFVYAVSFWGYRQSQVSTVNNEIRLNEELPEQKVVDNGRYQKSGLKDNEAELHLKKLVSHMNDTEAWLNSELSVGELAHQTHIPKHFITQILNEKLNKNFYTFVNEYRTEYAKKMLKSPEYQKWSMVAIGFECGFNSKTAFNTFFKKHTGMTPSEFKKAEV